MSKAPVQNSLRFGDPKMVVNHPAWLQWFEEQTALLPEFANNAAALAGGLVRGQYYCVTGSDPCTVAQVR